MRSLVEAKQVALLGVTQEQHPQRCRLFAQWKQLDWPILHDPINLLGARSVPIVVAIDRHGMVRNVRPTPAWVKETFIHSDYPLEAGIPDSPRVDPPDLARLRSIAQASPSFKAWQELGDASVIWGGTEHLDSAVQAYQNALQHDPNDARTHFRLGVALRNRYESERRQEGDFQLAVNHWTEALAANANQYIWRRRIQQFGPRLSKPYPFYDWVDQARAEVAQRGQIPIPLTMDPSGAEIAQPSQEFVSAAQRSESPDPQGEIARDDGKYIRVTSAVVPSKIEPGESVRLHLDFRPTPNTDWNNEAEPLRVWIERPAGWQVETQHLVFEDTPGAVESHETRRLEVELMSPEGGSASTTLRGYALYYICRKLDGTCLLRRQDLQIDLPGSGDR